MSEVKQSEIAVEVIVNCVEQKFANVALTGVVPSLAGEDFSPYAGVDGILRMKQHDDDTKDEADLGGLFVLAHEQPAILDEVRCDFSSSVVWSVAVVTSAGEYQVDAGTGRYVNIKPVTFIMPGETVKIVAAVPTGKPWVRIYTRLDQARR